MSEKDFWGEMRENVGHLGHFSRVESPQTSAGIPDVDFCVDGVEGHIELKFGRDTKTPSIRPSQVKWFKSRVEAGGHPIIFAKLIVGVEVRYCLYSGSKIRALFDAKNITDWIDLADVTYVSPHWEIFMFKIKDMCRSTAGI